MKRLGLAAMLVALMLTSAVPVARAATRNSCANWPMYGNNLQRTFDTSCPSSITSKSVARLVPAWVFKTPKPVTASPTVVDGVVYVGAWDGVMYSLNARTGRVRWRYQTPVAPGATYGPIVSSAAVGDITVKGTTQRAVVFGAGPRVYALRASDGQRLWQHDASHGLANTALEYESSPAIVDGLVIIGRDTHDEAETATAGERGGLIALRASTGDVAWEFHPELQQKGVGCGSVWGSPTVSPDHRTVFFGAANCPHDGFKWNAYTNALTALDLQTGSPKWSFQPTGPPDHDTDFGATPNYFVDRFNRPTLGAGKKDGTYYAVDPRTGQKRWSRHVQDPVPGIGGFIGSPAVSRGNVYGATAIGRPPYFHSIDATDGHVRFQGGAGPSYGATAVVNDVVFNAALDDLLKAFDAKTGRLLWAAPLSGPGSSGASIAGAMVFIGAGTSTSDACAKDQFYDTACRFTFDSALASLGGVHAFRLAAPRSSSQTVHTYG